VGRQKTRFAFQGTEFTQQLNQFSVSIGAAYEVDLWRRMANAGDAAALDALAVRDDVESIAITLAAEVAEAWFDLIAQRAQHKLISGQIETNETYLELVRLRFEKGLASALDVFQQRQQLVSTRAQLKLIESVIELHQHRLAVLAGAPPQGFAATTGDTLPPPPAAVPGTGLPADLLERRPDVRAARRRVEAADYRVAAAVADRLPALRLRGSTSLQSSSLADFIASPLWSIIASVTAPLLDGGRRAAEVERNRAVVEERLMGYGQVMLQAMVEVESALMQERQQLAYITDLEEAVELADATLREAQARYRQGLIDYLPVLAALQGLQRAELSLLLARRQLLSYRIQLCRALGGGWTQELAAPEGEES
jgi:NodT family efflux transporter outer membrane factor (OMF) lipoprotein